MNPALAEFSRQLGAILPLLRTAKFPPALAQMFRGMISTDDVVILVFPDNDLPHLECNLRQGDKEKSSLETYVKGSFLLDPYYLAATAENKNGFFCLNEIAPAGFTNSEYYRNYFRAWGLADECGYLVQMPDQGFINISLSRVDDAEGYSDTDLALLAELSPAVEALARQHWEAGFGQGGGKSEGKGKLRQQLERALDAFGTSVLTQRECQAMHLILRGYSTKAIADQLDISAETVKLHRRNAYSKLDINSQGELFHLFLDSLISIRGYKSGDPLVPYHAPTGQGAD